MKADLRDRIKPMCIVAFMILLDQGIKLYIMSWHMDKSFDILFGFVRFEPIKNIKYSWINSLFDLSLSKTVHIVYNILMLFLIILIYFFIRKMYNRDKLTEFMFLCIISASICSLIDKVFWNGSLDYIQFKGLFTFDLKDVYITAFEVILVGMYVFNYKKMRNLNEKLIFKDFKKYISIKLKKS